MMNYLKHLYRKLNLILKKDKRAKWPRSLFDVEQAVYPYFLQAFEMNPDTEYEKGRDVLDACVEEVYQRLTGNEPKVQIGMDFGEEN